MAGIVTEKEFEIHYYEVDYKKRLLVTKLFDYFTDLAIYQSEKLGIGLDYLSSNNWAWVCYKWDIDIYKYPKYGQKIIVKTRPHSVRRVYAYREFYIENPDGEIIAKANSIWILINTETKTPVKMNEIFLEKYNIKADEKSTLKINKINKIENVDNRIMFKIRYSDIDTNGHVNNGKYAAWMIESVPLDIVLNYTLQNLKVTYKKETKYGKDVEVLTQIIKNENKIICIHKIVENNEELTLGESIWQKC